MNNIIINKFNEKEACWKEIWNIEQIVLIEINSNTGDLDPFILLAASYMNYCCCC